MTTPLTEAEAQEALETVRAFVAHEDPAVRDALWAMLVVSTDYDEYLQTDHWKRMRLAALERAGRACQLCASDRQLEVHHRTYERLGCEEPSDLTVLCHDCHARFHGK